MIALVLQGDQEHHGLCIMNIFHHVVISSYCKQQVLEFTGNTSSHKEQIKILHNKNRKIRRAFSIRIKSRQSDPSHIAKKKTTVYIEKSVVSAVTFPLEPKVVSLRHYDDVNGDATDIPLGYPVVCVTVRSHGIQMIHPFLNPHRCKTTYHNIFIAYAFHKISSTAQYKTTCRTRIKPRNNTTTPQHRSFLINLNCW